MRARQDEEEDLSVGEKRGSRIREGQRSASMSCSTLSCVVAAHLLRMSVRRWMRERDEDLALGPRVVVVWLALALALAALLLLLPSFE